MVRRPMAPEASGVLLGKHIEALRKRKGLSCVQLGRAIKETEQQIKRYEAGALVPLERLEAIAEALGEPIPKRIIRRISIARKIEFERGEAGEELIALYNEAFEDSDTD